MLLFATTSTIVAKQNMVETPSYDSTTTNSNSNTVTPIQTFDIGRKTVYAWALNQMTVGPITFDLSNPGGATSITASASKPYAGTWVMDKWYIVTATTHQLKTVDPTTGAETLIGNTGVTSSYTVTGIAYDDVTETMYGTWASIDGTNYYTYVYSIDLTTAVATLVGSPITTDVFIDIACNSTGQFYGFGLVTDILYSFDPTVPSISAIGSLGININYAQGAECDKDTDILYLAGYTTSGALYTVNTNTGQATNIGAFPGGAEVDAFAIPYTYSVNNPPNTPGAPSGPTSGVMETDYSFTASTTDPEGDDIYYWFDWDDGTNTGWLGPYSSGATVTATHAWSSIGDYDITVKAKDEKGKESDFSPPHTITIVESPVLKIDWIMGGLFKVKTLIKNIGGLPANNIAYSITLTGGAFIGKETTGTIASLAPGASETVKSKFILGFGATVVKVTATIPESSDTKEQNGTVMLFFIKL